MYEETPTRPVPNKIKGWSPGENQVRYFAEIMDQDQQSEDWTIVKKVLNHRKKVETCQSDHHYQLLKKKLTKVRIEINRMLASQARVMTQMKTHANNMRRARVKTLIQGGALLNIIGLFQICEIKEEDDLQYDINSRDKAAILTGILLEAVDRIPKPPDPRQIEAWRESEIRFLKQRSAKMFYQKK